MVLKLPILPCFLSKAYKLQKISCGHLSVCALAPGRTLSFRGAVKEKRFVRSVLLLAIRRPFYDEPDFDTTSASFLRFLRS